MASVASVDQMAGGTNLAAPPQAPPPADGGRENIDLHELAKGWKAAIARSTDPATRHEAQVKNDRGNLPLHSAASFRAPLEVSEALLESYPEAASMTNNYGNLALHFTAWKKGPLDVEKLLLQVFPEAAAQKNNHGNLPLHYAAHYNAPLEVVEALYNAYPEGAHQKNNDSNTPLDLAIADGASQNVVGLLQGKSVPPSDDEMLEGAKGKCDRMEKELQRGMEEHDLIREELESVLGLLMDVRDNHPHALYSAGIDPAAVSDLDSLLDQVRQAGEADRRSEAAAAGEDGQLGGTAIAAQGDEDDELQAIEDALIPPDDEVETMLSKIIGLDHVKNQMRGLRRTIELDKLAGPNRRERTLPRHIALVGNPGSGKTYVARILVSLLHKIGAVPTPNFVEAGRDELVDRKSEARTTQKARRVLERASGGVLFIDEAYTLLPSGARSRGRDHGAAALKEIARSLPSGGPLVVLAGYPGDLQRVMASNIGFKSNFLLRVELPDPSPAEVSRMFLMKLGQKGYVPGEGLSVEYLSELIEGNTDEDWRAERNGRVADLLLQAVRAEVKRRVAGGETESRGSLSPFRALPSPSSQKVPTCPPEEIIVTVEDVQNAVVNGL
mmetsp:Transcript_46813/g.141798  ORF Transcript_46813/g.141798 Transcript_46813/m.141798 type:complete len:612 (-) Transcript_46813:52-1887(-)|eukprot:CAMPEP_0113584014 /NCGR_PEP_ID=MMETSP0015_2-20120614/32855_1 /TAXON_ID=2838 /ORGANISM="Odontella" /LENGTH=611 /DNA_ID=CAMNT_0000488991 /DNA_START=84 /DNA_END=1919 /DNA_ORIENTATION=+ /assembly_acc=CAM_ASM_000160